jgi:hypothetical protein
MRLPTIVPAMLLTLGAILSVGNYVGIVHARRKHVGFSCIPIVGGLLGCAGFLLPPRLKLFAFLPPLMDIGCMPMLFALLVHLLDHALRGKT